MKRSVLFLVLVFVLPVALAQSLPYCYDSVKDIDEDSWDFLGIEDVSFSEPCICYNGLRQESEWENLYCEEGKMKQVRTVRANIPPTCELVEFDEYQLADDERCKKCPDPVPTSGWKIVKCIGSDLFLKRNVTAYVFDPTVSDCLERSYVEMKFVENYKDCISGNVVEGSVFVEKQEEIGELFKSLLLAIPAIVVFYFLGKFIANRLGG